MVFSQGYSCLPYSIIRGYCLELMNAWSEDRLSSPDTNSWYFLYGTEWNVKNWLTIGSCVMKVIKRNSGMKRSQGEGIKYRMDCSWRKTSPGVMPTKGSLLSRGTSRECGIASFYCGHQADGFSSLWRIFSQETGKNTSSIVTSGLFWSIAKTPQN